MTRTVQLVFLLLAAALSGCVATPVPPCDRRVTIAEDLGQRAYVTDIRCVKNEAGYLALQANVVNNSRRDLGVEWKVVWLDGTGLEINSVLSSWRQIVIPPNDISGLKAMAPGTEAVDMRIYLRARRSR